MLTVCVCVRVCDGVCMYVVVQERGSTQHPARESHRRTEISTARAERNVVDENVRIVARQAQALDIALAALAHTGCGATTLHMHRQV